MIIDCHTHVFPPRLKINRNQYADDDPTFALIYSNSRAKLATSEELIESMDREGIEFSVIANYGWATQKLCVETNDYILEAVARYPKRLVGFCAIQPAAGAAALAEIERCVSGGMKGIGELRTDLQSFGPADRETVQPIVAAIKKHNLILLIHASEPIGHTYPGKGSVTPDIIYSFITTFPDLTLICAHWGGGLPFYTLMPEVKKVLKNVYFDTAASPFLYSPQIYQQVSQIVGAEKILFGSDYPLMPPSRLLREINSAGLRKEEKYLILSGNAQRLLGIGS